MCCGASLCIASSISRAFVARPLAMPVLKVGREVEIIKQWFDCCVTDGGLLVAQQKVPRSYRLVLQMVHQWLEAYRKLSPRRRLTDSQSGYSSDVDSDQEQRILYALVGCSPRELHNILTACFRCCPA